MNESFRRVIRWLFPGAGLFGLNGSSRRGMRLARRLAGAGLLIVLVAVGGSMLYRRSAAAIEIRHRPTGVTATLIPQDSTESTLASKAPSDRDDADAGVAEAARQFAITLITPELKQPDSATFPADAIRLERLKLMDRMTDGAIEHWLVDGAVDSRNDYGYSVRSCWRMMVARRADSFLPVLASLEGIEVYYLRSHADLLAEGREDAIRRRNAAASKKKTRSIAGKRAVWKALEAVKSEETKAQAALRLAVDLLAAGRTEPAHRRLQELIDNYPETEAAEKAAKLLKK
jgi:hypothetical protein